MDKIRADVEGVMQKGDRINEQMQDYQEKITKMQQESVLEDMEDQAAYWAKVVAKFKAEYWSYNSKKFNDADATAANKAIVDRITQRLKAVQEREN